MSELSRKVFNNENLLENILDHLSEDFIKSLNVRLVNSSFNKNFLRSIRKKNRRMKIECIGESEEWWNPEIVKDYIYINYRKVKKSVVPNCFRFLNRFANVKVEEIIVKNIACADEEFVKEFHGLIYDELIGSNRANMCKLIGLEELCKGCDECSLDMASRCREYGPLSLKTLNRLTNSKNFDKLHITDTTLQDIANLCSSTTRSKEACLTKLDKLIHSKISVDTLVFWINESREFTKNAIRSKDQYYMPREVIDAILKKWSVKSVKLNMIRRDEHVNHSEDWISRQFFSKATLKDAPGMIKESDVKISHVTVKMSLSHYCANGLMYKAQKYAQQNGYENMISNIRKLFPTNKISIVFSHWHILTKEGDIIRVMDNILRVCQLGGQTNLSVHCQLFTEIQNIDPSTRCPNNPLQHAIYRRSISWDDSDHGLESFKLERWLNNQVHVKDDKNEFDLKFDFYGKER